MVSIGSCDVPYESAFVVGSTAAPTTKSDKSYGNKDSRMKKWTLATIGFCIVFLSLDVVAVDAGVSPVRVLIVTGEEHPAHNWRTRTQALKEVFSDDKCFAVTITEDPEFLADKEIFNHDVLLLNFYSAKKNYPGAESRAQLQKFVKGGGGLFVLHFACGAFSDWPEYATLTGLIFTPTHRYKGHHDRRQPFVVDMIDRNHAISKGWKAHLEADDELYYCMGGKTREFHVLATARSTNTGENHPMAFCLQYGKGRVFNTPLGHDARACKLPDVAELIRRGTVWASGSDKIETNE